MSYNFDHHKAKCTQNYGNLLSEYSKCFCHLVLIT